MEAEDLADFPRPVHKRIPNFKGAVTAGQKIAEVAEFQDAKVVKVAPDKPQEEVRRRVLESRKQLLVPTPKLQTAGSLFNRIPTPSQHNQQELKLLASRKGIDTKSIPMDLGTKVLIDVVVVGSVAVDLCGRRIGKGEGYADLEFGLAAEHGMVNQNTLVVTTVHDCQVVESLDPLMFGPHDLPVDLILTPTKTYSVEQKLPKPTGILWDLLSEEKISRTPLLKSIRARQWEKNRA